MINSGTAAFNYQAKALTDGTASTMDVNTYLRQRPGTSNLQCSENGRRLILKSVVVIRCLSELSNAPGGNTGLRMYDALSG